MATDALYQARTEIQAALDAWDFSSCWPVAFTGEKKVITATGYPNDLISKIKAETNGMWPRPIIALYNITAPETFRSLGEVGGPGIPAGGLTRYARRVQPHIAIDCWADLQNGGEKMVERLAGQVAGCVFVNAHSLATYRYLASETSHLMYADAAQAWHITVTVSGYVLLNYDK